MKTNLTFDQGKIRNELVEEMDSIIEKGFAILIIGYLMASMTVELATRIRLPYKSLPGCMDYIKDLAKRLPEERKGVLGNQEVNSAAIKYYYSNIRDLKEKSSYLELGGHVQHEERVLRNMVVPDQISVTDLQMNV